MTARRFSPLLAALATALLTQCPVQADEAVEPLVTDRPDITEASQVVGPRRFQIETGILREHRSGRRSDERSMFTPTLFRLGFDSRWEARLETDGYSRSRAFSPGEGVTRSSGYSALAPGVKYHIRDAGKGLMEPSMGAIFHLNVPSGSGGFQAEKITGDLKLAVDWELAPKWSLGVNAGFFIDEDDRGEAFSGGLLTASLNRALTERFRSFVELAFQGPESSHGGRGLIFDGGFAYLVNPDVQLDMALGTGLSGASTPDFFWTLGLSTRF
jgi:hypothetical protein